MSTLGVVVNPTAGRGRARHVGAETIRELRARGHVVVDLSATTAEAATAKARQGLVEGIDGLVVVGGDGMVHLGVNVVAETTVPLGIVAAGTGNDVSRTLGLPRHDVAAAIDVIERALVAGARRVDAVSVGPADHSAREWFVGVLSCGFDAAVNARANTMTWPNGSARYVRAILAELRTHVPYGYRLTTDDAVWESAGTLVAVANGPQFGGGIRIAPGANLHDGMLDVVVAGATTRLGILQLLPGAYRGRHLRNPICQVLRTRSVLIEADTRLGAFPPAAFADGEHLGPLPLRATVHPGILGVLA